MSNIDCDYARAIKPVRNKMRSYNYDSVFSVLSVCIASYKHSGPDSLMSSMPWITERLLVWLLADDKRMYGNKIMRMSDARLLVREAWSVNGKLKHHYIEDLSLFMRMISISQLFYQRAPCLDVFSRHILILNSIPDNSRIKTRMEARFLMSADEFFKIAFSFYLSCIAGDFRGDIVDRFSILYGKDKIEKFIKICSLELSDARRLLRETRKIVADEWFQPSLLYRIPFVKQADFLFQMGAPTVARYFDTVVWEFLSQPDNADIKKHWEEAFCNYVGDSLRMAGLRVYGEEDIRSILAIPKSGKVCDFLVEDDDTVVLFEVKHKNNNQNLPAMASVRDLTSKLKATVVKGIGQLQDVFEIARGYDGFRGKAIYSVVVTSDDLMLGFSDFISGNDGLNNFVLSANDVDKICELVRCNVTSLGGFFADLSARQSRPETRMQYSYMIFDKQPYSQIRGVKRLDDVMSDLIERMRPIGS